MDKEFLEGLGLAPEAVEAILQQQASVDQAHQEALEALRMQSAVERAVHRARGKNVRAIAALLDLQAISQSQDRDRALEDALKTLKEENGYLFETAAPPPYAPFTGAAGNPAPKVTTLAGALRERMRK